MPSDDLRAWQCPNGHVLGVVKRKANHGTQLLLYRRAVDGQMERPREVDVMAVVEGSVMDIRCDICGEMRTWVIGQEALERLLERCGTKMEKNEKTKAR